MRVVGRAVEVARPAAREVGLVAIDRRAKRVQSMTTMAGSVGSSISASTRLCRSWVLPCPVPPLNGIALSIVPDPVGYFTLLFRIGADCSHNTAQIFTRFHVIQLRLRLLQPPVQMQRNVV